MKATQVHQLGRKKEKERTWTIDQQSKRKNKKARTVPPKREKNKRYKILKVRD